MSEENNQKNDDIEKDLQKSKVIVMTILGITGLVLIITGFFIEAFFDFINVSASKTTLYIFKMAFYCSGFVDFWMVNYVRKKL